MKRFTLLAMLMLASPATAGGLSIRDDARVVTADQSAVLQSAAVRWPFRLQLLTGSFFSRRELELVVHQCISAPDIVCVGIDPGHRFTATRFGTTTGVRPSDFNLVAAAGNVRFKVGDWGGGVQMIGDRASESIASAQAVAVPVVVPAPVVNVSVPAPTVVQQTTTSSSGWWTLFWFVFVGGVVWAGVAMVRRQRKLDKDMGSFREERDEYMNANVDRMTQPTSRATSPSKKTAPTPAPAASATRTPVTSSVVHHHHHDSYRDPLIVVPVIQPVPIPIVVPVAPVYSPPPSPSRSSDAGGGSSSFDNDFSSSSSNDSGGSSSDFGSSDSGGSADSGGGGSDF